MEKAELPAVIALLAHWDQDSSTFYIPMTDKAPKGYSEKLIDYISVFELDKIDGE